MTDEIQKSIKLINFTDSIFDQNAAKAEGDADVEKIMLRGQREEEEDDDGDSKSISRWFKFKLKLPRGAFNRSTQSKREAYSTPKIQSLSLNLKEYKFVSYSDLLESYFTEEDSEVIGDILVTYWPLFRNEIHFESVVKEKRLKTEVIEKKCFGSVLMEAERRETELLSLYNRIYDDGHLKILKEEDVNVLCKRWLTCQLNFKSGNFNVKCIARTFTVLEALEYVRLNPVEFYKKTMNNFIGLFNKFTNVLISEILSCSSRDQRSHVVKLILKLGKEFALTGAMNSLKSCLAALESNAVHRLHVINDQGSKYQKRFNDLSKLTSPEGNYQILRESVSLVPWLGIILRDFTFIKERHCDKYVNIPLAHCLSKLMGSVVASRETCHQFLNHVTLKEKCDVAVMKRWLEECEILYETEEEQFQRSLTIKIN